MKISKISLTVLAIRGLKNQLIRLSNLLILLSLTKFFLRKLTCIVLPKGSQP